MRSDNVVQKCASWPLAAQLPDDDTDNHSANDEDKNDDAHGFSGFPLQIQTEPQV